MISGHQDLFLEIKAKDVEGPVVSVVDLLAWCNCRSWCFARCPVRRDV